ncbi:MAG: LysM peptidoglycan-binding domain-containing protein [Clostridiaceae bacterium]|nr:LysM peptidoglycan-binding domain-containing protein [Clostridiaceae bacterium]
MKKVISIILSILLTTTMVSNVKASTQTANISTKNYTVQNGDSMWKICDKFQVGVSEIIGLNPQISDPNQIRPGNILKIPNLDAIKAIENQVISLVNIERSKVGIPALKGNWQLSRIARYKAEDMRDKNYFSHTSPIYGSPFDMLKKFGFSFSAAGENIAMGQQTPSEVMTSWMDSTGHRQNILNVTYTEIGVGIAKRSNGSIYWVQQFIRR